MLLLSPPPLSPLDPRRLRRPLRRDFRCRQAHAKLTAAAPSRRALPPLAPHHIEQL
jgi:hypothetical protein